MTATAPVRARGQAYAGYPPLRQGNQPDAFDGQRATWLVQRWHSQDDALLRFERQVEENVRMLAGQQWTFWVEQLGQFVDVEEFLTDDEKRWRQRPVFNRILYWFLQTHAPMTENPAIIGFLPGPDRIDAMLAEVMDIWWKTVWREADMEDVLDRFATWLLPGGRAHLLSRIDWSRGELTPWTAPTELPILGPDGVPVGSRQVPDVPHGKDGRPLAQAVTVTGELIPNGPSMSPHATHAGQIVVDVLSPLEVRGEYGPTPWHRKRWQGRKLFLTAEDMMELYQIEPKGPPAQSNSTSGGQPMLDRLLFGSGYYGANERRFGSDASLVQRTGFYTCLEYWERPCEVEGMEQRPDQAGGRHMVVCEDTTQVLLDGPREAPYLYTGPLRSVEFIRLPGRQHGTSLQDALNSPQRSFNRLAGHELEHAALMAHPIRLVARGTGLEKVTITNKPNQGFDYTPIPNVKAIEYAAPPQLSGDLLRTQRSLLDFMVDMGGTQQNAGEPPTRDASGELVKELRFDRNRWISPTMRRLVVELGRLAEDHIALAPLIFPFERMVQYTGEDNLARAIVVAPYVFQQGKVNVVPDPESMLPEGRGERQARVSWMYQNGLFGAPGSPEARGKFFELGRFAHLSRATKIGGVDRTMAEQNLGAILMGTPAAAIPLYPWYDLEIHRQVFESFMKGPEFHRVDNSTKEALATMWDEITLSLQAMMPPPLEPLPGEGGGPAPKGSMSRASDQAASKLSARPPGGAQPGQPQGLYQ